MNYSVRFVLLSVIILLISICASGQISRPGTPPGFLYPTLKKDLPVDRMRAIDTQRLLMEDMIFDSIKDIPWRFGDNIEVDIHPGNSGRWDRIENGRLWSTSISSPGAWSINLTFDRYHLPPGAELYIYNQDRTMVLGAFTDFNNQEDGYFATTLLSGDFITVEYFEPDNVAFPGKLNISTVTHAYRDPYQFAKAFGNSASCNLNVACEEASGWDKQIRSVVMLLTGSNGFCTGTVINNTELDTRPYVLSADHCYRTPSTVVFWFNWQSETCENPSVSPPYNSMSGATQRARSALTDFWLLELNQPIPDHFNVFYSGWNRTLDLALEETIAGIHHPRGDIKKFSYSESGVQMASYLGLPGTGTTHWRITWNGGTTTQPGSSGSAIFDSQKRIIGQLHGGYAECGNTQPDWYGIFGRSWTGGGITSRRLRDWLDPYNTDVMVLDGFDPLSPPLENPIDFTAVSLSSNEILLGWELNGSDSPVIIAMNTSNTFSRPKGFYSLDDILPCGSKVIYLGSEKNFLVENLDPQKEYFFRLWSYNSTPDYSTGIGTSAKTGCEMISTFPWSEGFNEPALSDCWQQEYSAGETSWQTGIGNNNGFPATAFEGVRNLFFRQKETGSSGNTTRLISPALNLSVYDNAHLSFYYSNPSEGEFQDTLRVYYKRDSDENWTLLEALYADQPVWTNITLDIPEMPGNFQFAFEAESGLGQGISLDLVEVSGDWSEPLPVPVNLAYSIFNDNQIELTWETNTDPEGKSNGLKGFNIYRNDYLIFIGEDPFQEVFQDHALPVGEYIYYVTASYYDAQESLPSNEVALEIAAIGNEVTLSISGIGSGTTFLPAGQYLFKPQSVVEVIALPDPFWYFQEWIIDENIVMVSQERISLAMDQDTDLMAIFLINKYTLELSAQPVDASSGLTGAGVYNHGQTAILSAIPGPGYLFMHWKEGSKVISTRPEPELTIVRDLSLTAEFSYHEYNIQLEANPEDAGIVLGAGNYGVNSEITVSALPNPGWVFVNWAVLSDGEPKSVSTDPDFTFLLSSDTLLTANFEVFKPVLTISVQGNGAITPETGEYSFIYGDLVELTAIPAEDWRFVNWQLNDLKVESSELSFFIIENTEARAIFEEATHLFDIVEKRLHVYPLPARQTLYVFMPEAGDWTLQLLTLSGQLLTDLRFFDTGNNTQTVSLDGISSGVYILRGLNNQGIWQSRIIVE